MRFLTVLVAVLSACAKIENEPDFPVPLITVVQGDNGIDVLAPDYQMHFRSGDFAIPEMHMPDRLTVGSKADVDTNPNLFGIQGGCSNEGNAGIAMFPAFATGTDPLPDTTMLLPGSEISQFLSGPFVAKIDVRYHLGFDCGGAQELTGESVFTFFPHGKIVRMDVLSSTGIGSPASCGCETTTSSTWAYTSYWSFLNGLLTDADNVDVGVPTPPGATNIDRDFSEGVCIHLAAPANSSVGVRYKGSVGSARRVVRGDNSDSVVYDLLAPNTSMIPAKDVNHPDFIFSGIQIAHSVSTSCDVLLTDLDEPMLMIDTGETFQTAGDDGIYDLGFRGGPFNLTAITPAPPDTTVVVELDSENVRVSQDPEPTNPPLIQREGGGSTRFLIIIPDGLSTTDKLIIEPL